MSWPNPADYQEAIQHPEACFSDPELRSGIPLADRWGLPRPVSGAFASVYRVDTGKQKHAVRCFLRYTPDIERRYAIISEHLARAQLPFIVEFKYLKQGIRVRGDWYPILKMDWVEGDRLDTYVARNLNNSPALLDLALKFFKLTHDLRRASIAHGDLQHGNILVVNGDLRLIDYDGMYVPGLAGWKSNELGQPNYQHPKRTEKDFGLYLDHFSEWVIYLTLLTLAVDPALRRRFTFGNEYILLSREDYCNPGASSLFRELEQDRDRAVSGMAMRIISFLRSTDLTRISSLDANLASRPMPAPSGQVPGWLADHMPAPAPARTAVGAPAVARAGRSLPPPPPRPAPNAAGGAWIQEQIQPAIASLTGSANFATSPSLDRMILVLTVAALLLVALATNAALIDVVLAGELMGATAAAAATAVGVRYKTLPEIRKRDDLLARVAIVQREIDHARSKTQQADAVLSRLRGEEQERTNRLAERQRELTKQEVDELEKIQNRLKAKVGEVGTRRQSLSQGELEERQRVLAEAQDKALITLLSQVYLNSSTVPGVDEATFRRLRERGIQTAADFTDIQWVSTSAGTVASVLVPGRGSIAVHGIRADDANALRLWRHAQEQRLAPQLPHYLSFGQMAWLKTKYEVQRRLVELDENRARQNARQSMEQVHVQRQQERQAIEQRLKEIPNKYAPRQQELLKQVAEQNKRAADRQADYAQLERELQAYRALNFQEYLKHIL